MRAIDKRGASTRCGFETPGFEIVAFLVDHDIGYKHAPGASDLVAKFLGYDAESLVGETVRNDNVQRGTEGGDP